MITNSRFLQPETDPQIPDIPCLRQLSVKILPWQYRNIKILFPASLTHPVSALSNISNNLKPSLIKIGEN